jgi:hypothetical protein
MVRIVFTPCYDAVPLPNRERKQKQYGVSAFQFESEISKASSVPEIGLLSVDSFDRKSTETQQNMMHFHGSIVAQAPSPTDFVQAVALREKS